MDGKDFTGTLYPGKMQARIVEIWGVLTGGRFEKGTGRSLLYILLWVPPTQT